MIALIDNDLLSIGNDRFPNLAIMKLSSYYKKQGHETKLILNWNELKDNNFEKIFLSKVFTHSETPEWVMQLPNLEYGGTGFFFDKAPFLPDEIEHTKPDYYLYNEHVQNMIQSGTKKAKLTFYTDTTIAFLCYDKETEVLTKSGWKLFKNCSKNDLFATLNQTTHELEYHKAIEFVNEPYEGDMIRFKNKYVDLLVTPTHNMYVNTFKEFKLHKAEDIEHNYKYEFKKDCIWNGRHEEVFNFPDNDENKHFNDKNKTNLNMNDWLEFLGYYLSEGNCYTVSKTRSYMTKISQHKHGKHNKLKGDVFEKIKQCINRLGYKCYINDNEGFFISNKQLYNYLKQFGRSYEKFVPDFVKGLSKEQIEIFINAYILGDGNLQKQKNGYITKSIVSSSKQIMNDFQELFLKIGVCGDIKCYVHKGDGRLKKDENRLITAKHDHYFLAINDRYKTPLFFRDQNIVERIKYKDNVYCVEVPNNTLYVRRNDVAVWSGNTRFCIRGCDFCVLKNYTKVEPWSLPPEWWSADKKYMTFLDDNFLAYPKWKDILNELLNYGKPILFKQGLDLRLMTDEKAEMLNRFKLKERVKFAFDNYADREMIIKKTNLWKKYHKKESIYFVLCAFDRKDEWGEEFWKNDMFETLERIKILMSLKQFPYIMRYNKWKDSPNRNFYTTVASWINQYQFYNTKSFREFLIFAKREKVLKEMEEKYPDLVKEYFDIKYSDFS